jgi:hypothetical protein
MQDGQLPFLNFASYHSEKLFHHTYYNIEPLDQHIIQEFQQAEGKSKKLKALILEGKNRGGYLKVALGYINWNRRLNIVSPVSKIIKT